MPRVRKAPAAYDPDVEASKPQLSKAAADEAPRKKEVEGPLSACGYGELQVLCSIHGISRLGKRPDLQRRLVDHLHYETDSFVVGDSVRAIYKGGNIFPATIASVTREGDYVVDWADGDTDCRHRARHEVLPPASGQPAGNAGAAGKVTRLRLALADIGANHAQKTNSTRKRGHSSIQQRGVKSKPRRKTMASRSAPAYVPVAFKDLNLDISAISGQFAAQRKSKPATVRNRTVSALYAVNHTVLEDDVISDGFYDAGRVEGAGQGGTLPTLSELALMPVTATGREVVVVDSRTDQRLLEFRQRVSAAVEHVDSVRAAVLVIALLVANQLGGSTETWMGGVSECQRDVAAIKKARKTNLVPIGLLRRGCCRHRAVLFKYLADHVSRLPNARFKLRCRLIRGHYYAEDNADQGHAWNAVWLPAKNQKQAATKGSWNVVDVMHEPTLVYEDGSDKSAQYKRLATLVDTSLDSIHAGGAGLNSIRLSVDPTEFAKLNALSLSASSDAMREGAGGGTCGPHSAPTEVQGGSGNGETARSRNEFIASQAKYYSSLDDVELDSSWC